MTEPVLAVEAISRRFGSLVAVDNVSFDVLPGDKEFIMLRAGDLGTVFPLMVMTNWHKARAAGLRER